jgi:hypothetical protein
MMGTSLQSTSAADLWRGRTRKLLRMLKRVYGVFAFSQKGEQLVGGSSRPTPRKCERITLEIRGPSSRIQIG